MSEKNNNVVLLPGALNCDYVLEKAKGEYRSFFIIGWAKDGAMDTRAAGDMTVKDLVYLIDKFKHKLLAGDYDP